MHVHIPGSYRSAPSSLQERDLDFQKGQINELRDRFDEQKGELSPELLTATYATVRAIGDEVVSPLISTDAAAVIGDAAEQGAIKEFFISDTSDEEGALARHNFVHKTVTYFPWRLSSDKLYGVNRQKHPRDHQIFQVFSSVAHEAAHALLNGLSQGVAPSLKTVENRKATRLYLARHPELGLTANWESDVWIHEERFAEGYSRLVGDKVLQIMGYTDRQRKVIMKQEEKSRRSTREGERGQNQIDHLGEADYQTAPAELVIGGAETKDLHTYKGKLGYGFSLTLHQVANQLEELAQMWRVGYTPERVSPDAEVWYRQVIKHRSKEITEYIRNLQRDRLKALLE